MMDFRKLSKRVERLCGHSPAEAPPKPGDGLTSCERKEVEQLNALSVTHGRGSLTAKQVERFHALWNVAFAARNPSRDGSKLTDEEFLDFLDLSRSLETDDDMRSATEDVLSRFIELFEKTGAESNEA
jgi:hypothetical protein